MSERPPVRAVMPGEMLAMDPAKIPRGPSGFFFSFGPGVTPNERRDDVAIVHVRGPLEHHDDSWGSESYEAIIERVAEAMSGADVMAQHRRAQQEHRWSHGWEDDYEPLADIEQSPPSAVVLCLDSPGGVVSGLNETVKALRAMRRQSKVKLVAYVNEMAASAAYALACACDEILAPPSAIVGSIGVVSTMISQATKDKADGYDVRLITSGERKSDGHPHVPITKGALTAERDRVDKLAAAFFSLASKSRGLSIEKIASYQAGIFLGRDAKKRGLVDSVVSLDKAILGLSRVKRTSPDDAGGNETTREVQFPLDLATGSRSLRHKSARVGATRPKETQPMAVALAALIRKTQAALAEERDPERYTALAMKLSNYMAASKDCDDEEEDDDDAKKAKKAKADASVDAAKKPPFAATEDGDEEEKAAKAALSLVTELTGESDPARARGALQAMITAQNNTAAQVAQIQADRAADRKSSLIKENAGKHLTRSDCEWLAGQPLATVEAFVAHRQKAGVIVHTDDSTIIRPRQATPGTEESLPAEVLALVNEACENFGGADPKAYRAALVEAHLKAHSKRLSDASNGAGRL